jgi:hypothetical protein
MIYIIMTTYSSRGKVLYKDVLNVESSILKSPKLNKSVEKQVESLELKLSSIRSDFEREAKLLISRVKPNKRSNQNIVNRSNKVRAVKVSEMNGAINKIRKLTSGNTTSVPVSEPPIAPPTGAQELMSTFEKLDEKLKTVGSRFQV